MPTDAQLLPIIVRRINSVLRQGVAAPLAVSEPSEFDFLEVMSSFHIGTHPSPDVPRTPQVYHETLSEYVSFLLCLGTILLDTESHLEGGGLVFNFDETLKRYLLDLVLADEDEYPMRNMIFRVASSVSVLCEKESPVFQRKFLSDLPTNVIDHIISFMDDASGFRFTRTCTAYRAKLEPRMFRSAFFRMRYYNHVVQGLSVIDSNALYLDVLTSMVTSRACAVGDLSDFMVNCATARNIRSLSLDNEWPRMWPRHISKHALLQDGTFAEIFDPLYNAICAALRELAITHLRIVSLALHPRLTIEIADSATITRLTVERSIATSQISDIAYHALRKMRNISHLRLGFTPDTYTHDRVWTTFALCPAVRHVYAFADPITRIGVEYPFYSGELSHIHDARTLHVHGSCPRLDNLAYWISAAGAARRIQGSLRRVKIQSYETLFSEEAYWLVASLARFHPELRILVLDGLDHVMPKLFNLVRVSFPSLEALCVVRRISPNMRARRLVSWDYPAHYYSEALDGHGALRHVEVNISCFGDALGPVDFDDADQDVPELSNVSSLTDSSDGEDEDEFDRAYNALSVARTFASRLPRLETFAVRNDITAFSCEVDRSSGPDVQFRNVRSGYPSHRFRNWNPSAGETWEDE